MFKNMNKQDNLLINIAKKTPHNDSADMIIDTLTYEGKVSALLGIALRWENELSALKAVKGLNTIRKRIVSNVYKSMASFCLGIVSRLSLHEKIRAKARKSFSEAKNN